MSHLGCYRSTDNLHSIQPIVEVSLGALSDLALFGSLSIPEAISTLSEYHWWTSVLQATCRRQVILPTQEGFWRAFTAEVGSHGIGAIPLVALYGRSADTEIVKTEQGKYLGNSEKLAGIIHVR